MHHIFHKGALSLHTRGLFMGKTLMSEPHFLDQGPVLTTHPSVVFCWARDIISCASVSLHKKGDADHSSSIGTAITMNFSYL